MARARRTGGYLPSAGFLGPMGLMGMGEQDSVRRGQGKSIMRQELNSALARRGAGSSQITGGNPGAHSFGHYGKKGLPGMASSDDEGLF